MRSRALPRLLVSEGALLFAGDHSVTHRHGFLATVRRINAVVVILVTIYLATFVGPMLRHWACYGDVGLAELDRGWCNNPAAPAYEPGPAPISGIRTWEWVSIGIGGVLWLAQLAAWIYVAVRFRKDVAESLLKGMADQLDKEARKHPHPKHGDDLLIRVIRDAEKEYARVSHRDHQLWDALKHVHFPLARLGALVYFPTAVVGNWLGVVAEVHPVLLAAHATGVAVFVLGLGLFVGLFRPLWRETCCIPKRLAGRAGIGMCDDARSVVANASDRLPCHHWSAAMHATLWLALAAAILWACVYVYELVAFHETMERLHKRAVLKIKEKVFAAMAHANGKPADTVLGAHALPLVVAALKETKLLNVSVSDPIELEALSAFMRVPAYKAKGS